MIDWSATGGWRRIVTTLYLLRHGEVHNPTGILYGRLPGFGLSDTGQQQAEAAGAWLADKPLAALYSSPMQRAQETAGFVAKHHKRSPTVDTRLNEVYTPYEGRPIAELASGGWDLYSDNEAPYEMPADILERVLNFFDAICQRHADESVAAVAHGDILVFSWLHAQGERPDALLKDRLRDYALPTDYPATASIMTFEFAGSPRAVAPQASYHCPY